MIMNLHKKNHHHNYHKKMKIILLLILLLTYKLSITQIKKCIKISKNN